MIQPEGNRGEPTYRGKEGFIDCAARKPELVMRCSILDRVYNDLHHVWREDLDK